MSVIDDFNSGDAYGIPTWWNGIEYKSGFEAEVAHWLHMFFSGFAWDDFNKSGIYENNRIGYEEQSFRLANGERYTPDWRILSIGESAGSFHLYVEARGYESDLRTKRLEAFGSECSSGSSDRLFLVFCNSQTYLYCPGLDRPFTNPNIYFIRCSYCWTPTVVGVGWVPMNPKEDWGVRSMLARKVGDEYEIGTVITPCHHCGMTGTDLTFSGCFQAVACNGRIRAHPHGSLLVPLDDTHVSSRWWTTLAEKRLFPFLRRPISWVELLKKLRSIGSDNDA